MSNNRRDFLNSVSLGVIGSTMLALPSQAPAFGRRRGRVCEPCIPEIRMRFAVGPFTFSFPLADNGSSTDPVIINGGGAFAVWGGYSTTDCTRVTDLQLVDTSTGSEVVRRAVSTGSIVSNANTNGTFAFYIPHLPGGAGDLTANVFRMRLHYVKNTAPQTPVITAGFFRCSTSLDA